MSGIDEQCCDIDICPNCNKDILTWPFSGGIGNGHFNIDLNLKSNLNNTVYLFAGMTFSNIESIHCYGCGYVYGKGSVMFKSIIIKAKKAIITGG